MAQTDQSPAKTSWHEQIEKIEAQLATLRPQLIEAEAELAERLAAIAAFEFKLRARIAKFTNKLDRLEAAIQELKRKMRWLGEGWQTDAENEAAAWAAGQSASEAGDYRYRDVPKKPRQILAKEEKASLKKLYRQLARRFHPDMAVDKIDRDYRTQMMWAINAAYAAGDLDKLEQLLLEPDAPHTIVIQSETEQLNLLTRELARLQNRLQEIEDELMRLDKHQSTEMMQRQARAARAGRNWFAEVEAQLREDIAQRQVEHDVLTEQLKNISSFDDTAVTDEDFPDIVLDATEDRTFESDIFDEFGRFNGRRRSKDFFE